MAEETFDNSVKPRVYPETETILGLIADHGEELAEALEGAGPIPWLHLSDKEGSQDELLQNLAREDINTDAVTVISKNGVLSAFVALAQQNDFLAAVARDWVDMRRSRLYRVARSISEADARGGDGGFVALVLKRFLKLLAESQAL